jgi:hypothetical protein
VLDDNDVGPAIPIDIADGVPLQQAGLVPGDNVAVKLPLPSFWNQ